MTFLPAKVQKKHEDLLVEMNNWKKIGRHLDDGILPPELAHDGDDAEVGLVLPHAPALALVGRVQARRLEEAPLAPLGAVEDGQGRGEEPLVAVGLLRPLANLYFLAQHLELERD